jgi:hypothetical protein
MIFLFSGCAYFQKADGTPDISKIDALASITARSAGRTLGLLRPEFVPVAQAYINQMKDMNDHDYRVALVNGLSTIMNLREVRASMALLSDAKDLMTLFGIDLTSVDQVNSSAFKDVTVSAMKAIVTGFDEGLQEAALYPAVLPPKK